mmetsp:Transcript_44884/g.95546  ORF Transcript_44884/g.95546 Transcript_44884/m.95546 type:complete len:292 (-) Transcript_44884:1329-2204(-)
MEGKRKGHSSAASSPFCDVACDAERWDDGGIADPRDGSLDFGCGDPRDEGLPVTARRLLLDGVPCCFSFVAFCSLSTSGLTRTNTRMFPLSCITRLCRFLRISSRTRFSRTSRRSTDVNCSQYSSLSRSLASSMAMVLWAASRCSVSVWSCEESSVSFWSAACFSASRADVVSCDSASSPSSVDTRAWSSEMPVRAWRSSLSSDSFSAVTAAQSFASFVSILCASDPKSWIFCCSSRLVDSSFLKSCSFSRAISSSCRPSSSRFAVATWICCSNSAFSAFNAFVLSVVSLR